MNDGPKDLLGREIKVDDVIAYPVTAGRSACMRIGRVTKIFHPVDSWTKKESGGWNITIQYMPETMSWGMQTYDPIWNHGYHANALAKMGDGPFSEQELDTFKYHKSGFNKAEKAIAEGPKPKLQTFLFPEKAVIITEIYKPNVQA